MPRMQRWVSGHSRSMQGGTRRHGVSTGALGRRPSGRVSRSSVGPKIAVTRTPSAAPKCIAPESFETSARHGASTPASAGRSVRPIRLMRSCRAPTADARHLVAGGSVSQRRRRARCRRRRARERRRKLGERSRRPSFRAAVRGAWREGDERRSSVPPCRREQRRRPRGGRPAARSRRGSSGPGAKPSASVRC